jgi:hypothetical protein
LSFSLYNHLKSVLNLKPVRIGFPDASLTSLVSKSLIEDAAGGADATTSSSATLYSTGVFRICAE